MKSMRTFENNVYMKAFRWGYILLIINIFFVLINIPLFLAFSFLAIDRQNLLFFLLAFVPFGGGFSAMLGTLERFIKTKEIEPAREFFQQMKMFWSKGTKYWFLLMFIWLILIVDLYFFAQTSIFKWLSPFLFLIGLLATGSFLNAIYFQIRNPLAGLRDVARISIYYGIKKWYLTVLNVVLLFLIPLCMLLKPQFGYLLTPSLFAGLIFLNCSKIHRE